LAIQLKDLRNALYTATQLQFDAPITQGLTALYAQAFEHGFGELDQSGLYRELQRLQATRA
jgi:2-hydroxy-3-oxopropionate reductase